MGFCTLKFSCVKMQIELGHALCTEHVLYQKGYTPIQPTEKNHVPQARHFQQFGVFYLSLWNSKRGWFVFYPRVAAALSCILYCISRKADSHFFQKEQKLAHVVVWAPAMALNLGQDLHQDLSSVQGSSKICNHTAQPTWDGAREDLR